MGLASDLDAARHLEKFAQDYTWGKEDFKEAVAAFSEKRNPEFTGE